MDICLEGMNRMLGEAMLENSDSVVLNKERVRWNVNEEQRKEVHLHFSYFTRHSALGIKIT